jgi:hypothetical protein
MISVNLGYVGKREISGNTRGNRGYQKNPESGYQTPGKQTLESLAQTDHLY